MLLSSRYPTAHTHTYIICLLSTCFFLPPPSKQGNLEGSLKKVGYYSGVNVIFFPRDMDHQIFRKIWREEMGPTTKITSPPFHLLFFDITTAGAPPSHKIEPGKGPLVSLKGKILSNLSVSSQVSTKVSFCYMYCPECQL